MNYIKSTDKSTWKLDAACVKLMITKYEPNTEELFENKH